MTAPRDIRDTLADCITSFGVRDALAQRIASFIFSRASGLRVTADTGTVATTGSITITKFLDEEGREQVDVNYDGMTVYEVVGLLTAELDTQRADLQRSRHGL